MVSVPLATLVAHCEHRLTPAKFTDYDRAWNGLQVENSGRVTKIAAAVDASLTTVELAIAAGADLLLVHHGLFWGQTLPWTGRRYALIRRLCEHNLAVYSQHLPLDGHPQLGNAAQLARALGFTRLKPFFLREGVPIGVQVLLARPITREALANRLTEVLGRAPSVLPGGKDLCQRIGICTGGAGAELPQAAREGVDTFITGEGPHWTFALAEDVGINAFYGGHYATETFGVKALAAELASKFRLPWEFLDHPSGL
ncbi:MAG TPA: Nif3-like dinuclear metal center hexameric protein [Candidatus Limnocylindria bacterium]|jgi:dinuclear metal center YbgI/SA1388 family protein|nr:Nif3-like dinuclear metal center hexameric protein [Candidatus Limnocylindria bacterium]